MTKELVGKTVGGWHIQEYVNHGKSAVVFIANKGSERAALKVFEPELVQRYGIDTQRKRIERELSLVDKAHPNLIGVYDGGEDGELLYIAMEYFKGDNLASLLREIPAEEVRSLISQIASAAKFLEESGFAHRDIKPENIGLSYDMKSAKLLDFGVVRPFDLSSITDEGDQRYFVGTLQYSPPELLFREEENSVEGWRAVSFYQLGAVLHDLLTRKPLFEEFKNPYARLVRAVEREVPRIDGRTSDADLRLLAQNCLAKSFRQRLDTVRWEDFSRPEVVDPLDRARRRIAQYKASAVAQAVPMTFASDEDLLRSQVYSLRSSIESAIVATCAAENLPRYSRQEVRSGRDVFALRTLFELRGAAGRYLAVYCQGLVLDARANLHELRLWACTSSTRDAVPPGPDSSAPSIFVKGVLIDQDIRTRIEQFLLTALAEAVDSSAGKSELFQWLKIETSL